MPEIRQSRVILDDFQRADENPLSHGGDWLQVAPSNPTVWGLMELENTHATHDDPLQFGFAYWNPLSLSGDDAECWAFALGGNASGTGWRVGLLRDVNGASASVDGYLFSFNISTGGGSTLLRRYTNGTATDIDTNASSPSTGNPGYLLIRRNGNDVEGWANTNAGDASSWTLYVSATDTSHTTDLHPAIGVSDNASQQTTYFDWFGGGAVSDWNQEFIRRPHNYMGRYVDRQ